MTALLTGKAACRHARRGCEPWGGPAGGARGSGPIADQRRGVELAAVPVLYAAAFDGRIGGVTLERMLISYESVIRGRLHRQQWENAVHGALRHYDLPDLARWLAPRRVRLVGPVDALGRATPVSEQSALRFRDIAAGSPPFRCVDD